MLADDRVRQLSIAPPSLTSHVNACAPSIEPGDEGGRVAVAVDQEQAGAMRRQRQRRGPTDPAAGAGDERQPASELGDPAARTQGWPGVCGVPPST